MIRNRAKSCEGKMRHASRLAARLAIERLGEKGMSPYRCPHCEGWHSGHHGARTPAHEPYRRQRGCIASELEEWSSR